MRSIGNFAVISQGEIINYCIFLDYLIRFKFNKIQFWNVSTLVKPETPENAIKVKCKNDQCKTVCKQGLVPSSWGWHLVRKFDYKNWRVRKSPTSNFSKSYFSKLIFPTDNFSTLNFGTYRFFWLHFTTSHWLRQVLFKVVRKKRFRDWGSGINSIEVKPSKMKALYSPLYPSVASENIFKVLYRKLNARWNAYRKKMGNINGTLMNFQNVSHVTQKR